MKRLFTFLSILAFSLSLAVVTTPSVYADPDRPKTQTQEEATACFNRFDYSKTNRTYADGSQGLTNILNNPCFQDYGNCRTSGVAGTTRSVKVQCTKKPGTNKAKNDQAQAESEAATEALHNSGGPAGYTDPAVDAATCNKNDCELLAKYLNPFIRLLSYLVGIAVVIGIMVGAIQVITSAGDPQKNAKGKDHIRNALIAALAYVILFAFLQWVIPGGVT